MEQFVPKSKARRLLGKKADKYSDTQLQEVVHNLHLIARDQLRYNGSKESDKSNESKQPKHQS